MRNCLFVQWKNPTDASRFVIDGQACEYSGTELQDKMMKIFANVPKYREICSNKGRNDLSPSFRCSCVKTKSSILNFVEGNFEETDCSGRKLVYIFATFESDSEKIVDLLKESAFLLGVTPHAEDLEEIKKKEFKIKSNNILLCVIILTIILLLSYMLLNHLSKQ
jgi:hypothetical protein